MSYPQIHSFSQEPEEESPPCYTWEAGLLERSCSPLVGHGSGTSPLPEVYEGFIGMGQAERLRVLAGESAWGIEAVHGKRATVLMPQSEARIQRSTKNKKPGQVAF